MDKLLLSTVTPVYRGAAYVERLVEALAAVRSDLQQSGIPVELTEAIFVDDAAVDGSAAVLAELERRHPWVRVIHLSRNFGQHPATVAGILHTSGDWIATLDEDLQHDPKYLLPLMTRAVTGGFDIVYASPTHGVHHGLRDVSSRGYKSLMSFLSGTPVTRQFSSFRLVRGSIARAACSLSTHDTYLDVILNWFTTRVASLPIPLDDVRVASGAKSGYSFLALLRHARRLLISSEIKPLRIGAAVGLSTIVASILFSLLIVIVKVIAPEAIELRGWASLMIVTLFFGGLTSFLVGIVLEYLSTVVLHTLGKPTFFVVDRSRDALLAPEAAASSPSR